MGLSAGSLTTAAQAVAPAITSTTINVDGTQGGSPFDGIGAISGGGGNSRLLTDYPATQQSQILDYLFKPDYGANLQILKVEIGGDSDSTDGAESSIEPTKGNITCTTGYEWWLMQQAKDRDPSIKFYGLAWAAPGWISGGFWSQDTINYLISWLGCAKSNGLTISYLGGWNERYSAGATDDGWFVSLRSALDSAGYSGVQIVGADSDWSIATDMASDPALNNAVSVLGAHYPCSGGNGGNADSCTTPANVQSSGKPIWASENGSLDYITGAPEMARSIVRGYVDGRLTAYINWPLIASIYPNQAFNAVGLMVANQPWSGSYAVGSQLWVAAQVTQFTAPGWTFINSASGYLGSSESNGSYTTLKSPNGSDYSTILETSTATSAQTATFHITGGLSTGQVHVWSTNVNSSSPSTWFNHVQDLTPSGGSYTLTLQPGYIYTVTTTSGQSKGAATSPPAGSLALPYSDNLDGATGAETRYLANQQGDFQSRPCAGGRAGNCLQQMTDQRPIQWFTDNTEVPFATLGDTTWTNYTVSVDALIEQAGAVRVFGRVNTQAKFHSAETDDYFLQVGNTGAWSIVKSNTSATLTTLASGSVAALGTGTWHTLSLTFNGATISAAIDGVSVSSTTDSSYDAGQVGLGINGYQTDQFADLSITPGSAPPAGTAYVSAASGKCLDDPASSTTNGVQFDIWSCNGGANQQLTSTAGTLQVLGRCLDAAAQGTTPGTKVDLWSCNGGANQQWTINPNGTITGKQSGLCLDVRGDGTANGTLIDIWTCTGAANQHWTRS
jgi:hypothetical protein